MADPKVLKRLMQGVEVWNRRAAKHVMPRADLSAANLREANLTRARLISASLIGQTSVARVFQKLSWAMFN